MKKMLTIVLAIFLMGSLVLVGCSDDTTQPATTQPTTSQPTTTQPATTQPATTPATIVKPWEVEEELPAMAGTILVNWDEAADYSGQTVTVFGEVLEINDLSASIQSKKLVIGAPEGEGFQIEISNADEPEFPSLDDYVGKNILVTGTITENIFWGIAEVKATDPSVVTVAVNWDEAADYSGQAVTVFGEVLEINDLSASIQSKKLVIGAPEGEGFQIEISNADEPEFPPLDDYVGQTVFVTGTVTENIFWGVAEVLVTDPSAILILE